jgi:hypothetical protein
LIKEIQSYNDDEPVKQVSEEEIVKKVKANLVEEQQEEKALEVLKDSLSKFDEATREKYLDEFEEVL